MNIILNQPNRRRVSNDRLYRKDSHLVASLEVESSLTPAGKCASVISPQLDEYRENIMKLRQGSTVVIRTCCRITFRPIFLCSLESSQTPYQYLVWFEGGGVVGERGMYARRGTMKN